MSVWVNFVDNYIRGMRDRRMQGGKELSGEIQLTYWPTAGEQGKLVFVVSPKLSLVQFISLFTAGKENRLSIVQLFCNFNLIRPLRVSRKPVRRIKLGFKKNFFTVRVLSRKILILIRFVACAVQENLSNRSSRIQIRRDI